MGRRRLLAASPPLPMGWVKNLGFRWFSVGCPLVLLAFVFPPGNLSTKRLQAPVSGTGWYGTCETETETAALIRDLSPPRAYDTTTTTDPGLLPPAVLDKGGGDDGDGATIISSGKVWCSQQGKRAL